FQPPRTVSSAGLRPLLPSQPVQFLLLDTRERMSPLLLQRLLRSALHTLALALRMPGPRCPVPALCIIVIGQLGARLALPSAPSASQLAALANLLNDIAVLYDQDVSSQRPAGGSPVAEALQMAAAQQARLPARLQQLPCELTLISRVSQAAQQASAAVLASGICRLRRFRVLLAPDPAAERLQSTAADAAADSCPGVLVRRLQVGYEQLGLASSAWLIDSGTETVAVKLLLPCGLQLLLDAQEAIVNPQALTQSSAPDLFSLQPVCRALPARQRPPESASVCQLRAVWRLPKIGICPLLCTMGAPVRLRPTACWRLDWDQLSSNVAHFDRLLQRLLTDRLALLVRLEPPSPKAPQIRPLFYLTVDSPGGCLLLRPAVPAELVLPSESGAAALDSMTDADSSILAWLEASRLPMDPEPGDLVSGLCASLTTDLLPGGARQQKQQQQLQQPTRFCTNLGGLTQQQQPQRRPQTLGLQLSARGRISRRGGNKIFKF
ncbi:hypothetical protein BOX15_Mlig018016g1, partial [Macrostomum lignano]